MKKIKTILIEARQKNTPLARHARATKKSMVYVTGPPQSTDQKSGHAQLYLSPKKGKALGRCASWNQAYICCNTHVLRAVSACPYQCAYCFLQHYLNNNTITVTADIEALLLEVKDLAATNPNRLFRIGTWELGDSLALDPLIHQAPHLIKACAKIPNVLLDLRTKAADINHLLKLDHNQHTVLSWSLNPQSAIKNYETGTATLPARLNAIKKAAAAGYLISIHFDPMLYYPNWEFEYTELVNALFSHIKPAQIAWISIGSLRFHPDMKHEIKQRLQATAATAYPLTAAEMVRGSDNKLRYIKPLRIAMYRHLYAALKKHTASSSPMIYLCMERPDMWQLIFKTHPKNSEELDLQFAQSIHRRFQKAWPKISAYPNQSFRLDRSA